MERLKNIAGLVLAEARRLGADFAQCTVSEEVKHEFNVDGGRFSLMRTLFDRHVEITVLKAQRKGSVAVNRFDEEAVRAAVADCMAVCESSAPDEAWQFAEGPAHASFRDGAPECDTEQLFARTEELLRDIGSRHPKILVEQMITDHTAEKTVFMNSQDVCYETCGGSYHFSVMYSAHEGEKGSSFFFGDVTLDRLDRPVIDCAFMERDLQSVEKQIDTMPLEGKFVGTAVLAPDALSGTVLSTILGSFVSDGSLMDGSSIWKDRLGSRVASEALTLSMTPRAEYVVGGAHYTSEGYPAEDFDVIRDGVLENFALSQYGANKTGGRRAGNDAWNLTVRPGAESLEKIISGIEQGILVMRFSGGEPAPNGEFSGVAKNSFRIEHGQIREALAETMISGCVPDMLEHIRGISSDVLYDGSNALPYIAFDGVTISGK